MLLTYVPEGGAQRPPTCISAQDSEDARPLDVALATQQWRAVRLLIAAGALQACPELARARQELQQLLLLPDGRRQSGALQFLVSSPETHLAVLMPTLEFTHASKQFNRCPYIGFTIGRLKRML